MRHPAPTTTGRGVRHTARLIVHICKSQPQRRNMTVGAHASWFAGAIGCAIVRPLTRMCARQMQLLTVAIMDSQVQHVMVYTIISTHTLTSVL